MIQDRTRKLYDRAEPFYGAPAVLVERSRLALRNDVIGKGSYHATRGATGQRLHQGVDILTPIGGPVYASKSGRVCRVAVDEKGYGLWVEIGHPDGRRSRYAHLSAVAVQEGAWVSRGNAVGLSGASGNASDPNILPHLHFEIRDSKGSLDPGRLLDPKIRLS